MLGFGDAAGTRRESSSRVTDEVDGCAPCDLIQYDRLSFYLKTYLVLRQDKLHYALNILFECSKVPKIFGQRIMRVMWIL